MIVWIDAARGAAERVFGLGLLERHLKALKHRKVAPSEIVVDLGDSGRPEPVETRGKWPFPIRIARGAGDVKTRITTACGSAPVLAVEIDTLADARLYDFLAQQRRAVAAEDRDAVLALITDAAALRAEATSLRDALPADFPRLTQDAFPGFIRNLRRTLPFYLFKVTNGAERKAVERFLFWSNYKGSTDFFTKYVYPPLVWLSVRPLARLRVHPNWVTAVSILLTLAVVPLAATGHFLAGFLCAYGMSVLDSVDGKLARLTFTDSRLGNFLDHGLDMVHPPIWYVAWAYGIGLGTEGWGSPLGYATIAILVFYVLDRLILKIYPRFFQRGFHTHSKMDATVRSFIARRNINLPLFLLGIVFGLGREAFFLISAWQIATAAYHGVRTFWILAVQKAHRNPQAKPAHVAADLD